MDIPDLTHLTPLMRQYFEIKAQFDDAILLFQVGDFYELFFDDAKVVADFLGIALTKRGKVQGEPVPLCGFPVHALDHYAAKLVKGGFKVALCQQLEDAVAGKTVTRGVTQVFTPGTLVEDNLLDAKKSSFLFSFFPTKDAWGLVFSELLTSQLHATILPVGADRSLETELLRFLPDEVLLLAQRGSGRYEDFFKQKGFFTTAFKTPFDREHLDPIKQWCKDQFDANSFEKLYKNYALSSAFSLWYAYLAKHQSDALKQNHDVHFYDPEEFLLLDGATQKNLDIVRNSYDGSRKHSLLSFVDRSVTPMGSRTVHRWLVRPLLEKNVILQRQEAVTLFVENPQLLAQVKNLFAQCGDMERVIGRVALRRGHLRDYVQLGRVLSLIPQMRLLLQQCSAELLQHAAYACVDFSQLHDLIKRACNDDETEKWIIKAGFSDELDRIRDLVENSSKKFLELEQREQAKTGISSLKIRQNNVHGYYIEVTKANAHLVPDEYQRQQTLVGRERYTMPILQQLQGEMMQAQQSIDVLEKQLFEQVKAEVEQFVPALRVCFQAIARVDALAALATVAYEEGYCRPSFNDKKDIFIEEGKHPIVSSLLRSGFIANDTQLTDQQSLWIVTGPNMGGKSTYLRQVALICLLAQMGSFVPARAASLPILDRIFTRIGAGDNLAEGKSTFLVEMEETAQICLQATERSLVILDEVGRGTSTFDGLALAQAVVEYIYQQVQARCLFATHYHELTHLQDQHDGIVSYYADSKKTQQGIVLLHKIVRGVADGSFGIEVAKLAKLPPSLIHRAQHVLAHLHQQETGVGQLSFLPAQQITQDSDLQQQYDQLQEKYHALVQAVSKTDLNHLSPKEAFDLLWDLQQQFDNAK